MISLPILVARRLAVALLSLALLAGGLGRAVFMAGDVGAIPTVTIAGIVVSLCAPSADGASGKAAAHHACDLCAMRMPFAAAGAPVAEIAIRNSVALETPVFAPQIARVASYRPSAQPRGPPIA